MTRMQPRWIFLISALSALMLSVVGVAAAGSDGDGEASDAHISTPTALSEMAPAQDVDSESDSSPASSVTGLDSPEAAAPTAQAAAAVNAHENGHGCDDIMHSADAPGPGGPVGCDVGNSGDHRQNGVTDAAEDDDGEGPAAALAETPQGDKADPHANGHGCDDVNHADGEHEPTHGGPVGCDVGNSGDHRQNGVDKGSPDDASAPTSSTNSTGPGNAPAGKGAGVGKGPKK